MERVISIQFSEIIDLGKKSGDDVAEDTPVPIPNTEVKLSRGEGSESRLVRIASCQAFFNALKSFLGTFFIQY